MDKLSDFSLNMEGLCKFQGLAHVYMTNINHVIINFNELQFQFMQELLDLKREDIIGSSLETLLHGLGNFAEVVIAENELVMQNNMPKQFYNYVVTDLHMLELLTIKMPTYDSNNKIAGVLGISQYVNKFSMDHAYKLGLSKREIECLFFLIHSKTNKEIAKILKLSVRTIENYVENLRNKFGCYNNRALIHKTLHSGLITGLKLKESETMLELCDANSKMTFISSIY